MYRRLPQSKRLHSPLVLDFEILKLPCEVTMNYRLPTSVCDPMTKRALSATAGALLCATGYDRAFTSFAPNVLTPEVHYMLAGMAVDVGCRGADMYMGAQEIAISAGAGFAGALLYKRFIA